MRLYSLRWFVGVLVVAGSAACSTSPDEDSPSVAYKNAESGESLVVPPDLRQPEREGGTRVPAEAASGTGEAARDAGAAEGASAGQGRSSPSDVLPQFDGIRLVRNQETAWIELGDTPPDRIWPRLDDFLRAQGFEVATKRPELGIIETGWFDRQDMPNSGGLSGFLSGIFGGGPESVKDKYQIRLERANGGTRVFVEQRSLAEVAKAKDPKRSQGYRWKPRQGQPALENEMRRRLLVYLGVSEQRAEGVISDAQAQRKLGPTPVLVRKDSGAYSIRIDDNNLPRAYARVGEALKRIDARVIAKSRERNRARYGIEWSRADGDGDSAGTTQALQVRLQRRQDGIRIVAADRSGEARSGPVHQALLRRLTTAMGGQAQARSPSDGDKAADEQAEGGAAGDEAGGEGPFERPKF